MHIGCLTGKITSLLLLTTLLVIHPRFTLALFATASDWELMFSCLPAAIPKPFQIYCFPVHGLPFCIQVWTSLFVPRCLTLHFAVLKNILFEWAQVTKQYRSFCIISLSSSLFLLCQYLCHLQILTNSDFIFTSGILMKC